MYELKMPINIDANGKLFNSWMIDNHTYMGVYYDGSEVVISFLSEPDTETKDEITDYYNGLTETDSLFLLKEEKMEEINTRTSELISEGFAFAGKVFSLSSNAQTNLIALFATKDNPALTYPLEFNTLNDLDSYTVLNAATIEGMYLTALGTKKGCLDSGSILKDQARSSTNKAEIDLVIDQR